MAIILAKSEIDYQYLLSIYLFILYICLTYQEVIINSIQTIFIIQMNPCIYL